MGLGTGADLDVGGSFAAGVNANPDFALIAAVFSVMALGLFAILQGPGRNDDDDSGPGGGLMQPVA